MIIFNFLKHINSSILVVCTNLYFTYGPYCEIFPLYVFVIFVFLLI